MREHLAPLCGKRGAFTARFVRTGKTSSARWKKTTRLFVDICHGGKKVADHVWFKESGQWKNLELKAGDVVHFTATVTTYEKGYKGRRWQDDDDEQFPTVATDYKLARPKRAYIVTRANDSTPRTPDPNQIELRFPS